MANFPHKTLPILADASHPPYAGPLDSDQATQIIHVLLSDASHAPVMDSQMQGDNLMTSSKDPNQFQFQLLPLA